MKRIQIAILTCLLASACAKKKAPLVPAALPPQAAPTPVPQVKEQAPLPTPPPPRKPRPAAPPVPNTPPPQLGEILSPERRRQLDKDFQESIARAKAALDRASKFNLNADQRNNAARIRTFIAQAVAAREKDLTTALQLARRADLLGVDLQQSLR